MLNPAKSAFKGIMMVICSKMITKSAMKKSLIQSLIIF